VRLQEIVDSSYVNWLRGVSTHGFSRQRIPRGSQSDHATFGFDESETINVSGHGSSTDVGLEAVILAYLFGEAVNLIGCFVRDGFSCLVSLDPFSVFARTEEIAGLDFNYRVQIGRTGDPGAQWREKSKHGCGCLGVHNVCFYPGGSLLPRTV